MNKRIYVAGPYTLGNKEKNVLSAIRVGSVLIDNGFYPYIPHLAHYWDKIYPREWEEWMKLDLAFLDVCNGVFRIKGPSRGADIEEKRAYELGLPVFYIFQDLFLHKWED